LASRKRALQIGNGVKLSKHTADEMTGRGILLSYIEAALTSPDRVVRV
jgi:hypothetical protein